MTKGGEIAIAFASVGSAALAAFFGYEMYKQHHKESERARAQNQWLGSKEKKTINLHKQGFLKTEPAKTSTNNFSNSALSPTPRGPSSSFKKKRGQLSVGYEQILIPSILNIYTSMYPYVFETEVDVENFLDMYSKWCKDENKECVYKEFDLPAISGTRQSKILVLVEHDVLNSHSFGDFRYDGQATKEAREKRRKITQD